MSTPELTVAIDVGGTNTDAVCLDAADTVLARAKCPTTADIDTGMGNALSAVLTGLGADVGRVGRVMLGTTHATNAILERTGLLPTATVRIGAPATTEIPPLAGWPAELRAAVDVGSVVIAGGCLVDGTPLAPLDLDAVARFVDEIAGRAAAVAVTGVFSPAAPEQEQRVAELIHARAGAELPVSCSHEVGVLGLLERENATVLNASLAGVAGAVSEALEKVLRAHGLDVPTYFAQNDGTLMALEHAGRFPVLTIGSGPANSIRGAAFLSGLSDAVIADVGGTSTDLGVISGGYPQESALATDIGGLRTNSRMPDILSLAIGGGTVVRAGALGPESVGYRIGTQALAFGGSTPTLTDAALAAGRGQDRDFRPAARHRELLAGALHRADAAWADAVDRVSLGRADRPLVVVGGGAFMVPDTVPGTLAVLRPEHADVANAVGAAIAPVAGRAEVLHDVRDDRGAAIERAEELAVERAVRAGAAPSSIERVEVLETPLSYLSRPTSRISVKVAGRLGSL